MASEVLRNYIRGMIVESSPISANYQHREDIRAYIQAQLTDLIDSGEIATQEDAESFLMDFKDTVDMAVNSLKMIPVSAFVKAKSDLDRGKYSKKLKAV